MKSKDAYHNIEQLKKLQHANSFKKNIQP